MKLSRLALAVALLPLAAHAEQSNAYQDSLALPPLVVTSGRHAEPIQQATAVTTVFTRQDIERLQVRSVAELLERVPGVSVSRTGGAGSQTGLFVRGTATAQTLVLLDGQRISAASSGTSSLEFLSPEQIEALDPQLKKIMLVAISSIGSELVGKLVTRPLLLKVLQRIGLRLATKSAARFVPLLGQALAASLSFGAMKLVGNAHVDDCYAVARKVLLAGQTPAG
mgnify:CR=1 FL=1